MSGRSILPDQPDPTRLSDDHWEAAMRDQALNSVPSGSAGRWFDLCFRLIILALALMWLFVPPAGETAKRSETTIEKATR